jgi:hypothetical protein
VAAPFIRPDLTRALKSATPRADHHISPMTVDLDETETAALTRLLRDAIDGDRNFLSQRVQTLRSILGKLRPEPARAGRVA